MGASWGGGCQLTARGARKSHLCADHCVLRKPCLGRSGALCPCGVWPESDAWSLTTPSPRVRPVQAPAGSLWSVCQRGGGGGRAAVKWRGRFSTNPKPERGIFEILTNPKPEAGTRCSRASNLHLATGSPGQAILGGTPPPPTSERLPPHLAAFRMGLSWRWW